MVRFGLIVPTLNPGSRWVDWLGALTRQSVSSSRVLVVDSDSDDGYLFIPDDPRFVCRKILRSIFNHGGTRQWAFEQMADDVDVVVMMTQDVVLADDQSLQYLLAAFEDDSVGAAYGRQIPLPDAGPFGAHARLFNYGGQSAVKQLADRDHLGIKACFLSNSFAAYRCRDLEAAGGFPVTDFGEDMLVAARLLLNGRRIAYVADACVYHSHDYSIMGEFRRYQATGQFHARHPWLLEAFGGATGEGRRFLLSEARYLLKHAPHLLPAGVIRTAARYLGYREGRLSIPQR